MDPSRHRLSTFFFITNIHLRLIADGQIYTEYPKEACIFYGLLRDRVAPALAESVGSTEASFFLKHVDDKGDHILIDGEYNITGIIDWQFSRFVPASEAFGPSLFTAELNKLCGGETGLSQDDRLLAELLTDSDDQNSGIGTLARGSELARRFQFGLASGLRRNEVVGLTKAVLVLLDSESDIQLTEDGMKSWMEAEWAASVDKPWYEQTRKLDEEIRESQK